MREIYLTHSLPELLTLMEQGTECLPSDEYWSDSVRHQFKRLRDDARKALSGSLSPIILAGHQPLYYHPGILMKDYLADALAKISNGKAFNLVVDTDEGVILFSAIGYMNGTLSKMSVPLNKAGEAFMNQKLSDDTKDKLLTFIDEQMMQLSQIYSPDHVSSIREALQLVHQAVSASQKVIHPAVKFREMWEEKHGLNIQTIYVSELARLSAFKFFIDMILERENEFRTIYNQALHRYRKLHKIKNQAQPLPDLDTSSGELPFWVMRNHKREKYNRHTKLKQDEMLFPGAITLTLFCRLFLCNIMIHGKGGGRYDQITDHLLTEFFGCGGAPFTVASATLNIHPRADYPLSSRTLQAIDHDIRKMKYDPVHFLPLRHELRKERDVWIQEHFRTNGDRAKAHKHFINIREKAELLLQKQKQELMLEKQRANRVYANQKIFNDRTFPFFYYDLSFLTKSTDPYRLRL